MTTYSSSFHAVEWRNQALHLLDQRVLPHQHLIHEYTTAADVADAIRDMVVRGAPAIGIAAAYGYALDALAGRDLEAAYRVLAESRPTAVNLFWALERMASLGTSDVHTLVAEAKKIHDEDISANLAMGEYGASLLSDGSRVYTHCNTGALATGGHGTALGIIRTAMSDGKIEQVYAGMRWRCRTAISPRQSRLGNRRCRSNYRQRRRSQQNWHLQLGCISQTSWYESDGSSATKHL